METIRLIVPSAPKPQDTLELSVDTCNKLFDISQIVCDNLKAERMFSFDFSSCRFVQPSTIVILGGLLRLIKRNGLKANFSNFSNPAVKEYLEANGFLQKFKKSTKPPKSTAVPYEEFVTFDRDIISEYLSKKWLGRGWINVPSTYAAQIVGRVLEIYINSFDHSRSPIGVISTGQMYPNVHYLTLSVCDFGVGIPQTVREFVGISNINPINAIRWAVQRGKTTKAKVGSKDDIARGLGFDLLKQFVLQHKGRLEIFSESAYIVFDGSTPNEFERFGKLSSTFRGTLVNISIRTM